MVSEGMFNDSTMSWGLSSSILGIPFLTTEQWLLNPCCLMISAGIGDYHNPVWLPSAVIKHG